MHLPFTASPSSVKSQRFRLVPTTLIDRSTVRRLEQVNNELWILLSLFLIAFLLNQVVSSQKMVLGFYVLPTLASARFHGRREATLTAFASVLIVVVLLMYRESFGPTQQTALESGYSKWLDVTVWGGSVPLGDVHTRRRTSS